MTAMIDKKVKKYDKTTWLNWYQTICFYAYILDKEYYTMMDQKWRLQQDLRRYYNAVDDHVRFFRLCYVNAHFRKQDDRKTHFIIPYPSFPLSEKGPFYDKLRFVPGSPRFFPNVCKTSDFSHEEKILKLDSSQQRSSHKQFHDTTHVSREFSPFSNHAVKYKKTAQEQYEISYWHPA